MNSMTCRHSSRRTYVRLCLHTKLCKHKLSFFSFIFKQSFLVDECQQGSFLFLRSFFSKTNWLRSKITVPPLLPLWGGVRERVATRNSLCKRAIALRPLPPTPQPPAPKGQGAGGWGQKGA